jgi:S1-C subfamily serine protease
MKIADRGSRIADRAVVLRSSILDPRSSILETRRGSMTHHDSYGHPPRSAPQTLPLWPLVLFLSSLVLILGGMVYWLWQPRPAVPEAKPREVTERGPLTTEEQRNIDVYKKAGASVVHVTNIEVRRDTFSLNVYKIPRGSGTGFIWDEDGHIVTNFHVVEGASVVRVVLADHSSYETREIRGYPDKDLAVLRIRAPKEKLKPIPVGESSNLQVGQQTWAIGNPFGLDQTLTTGIISALDREIQSPTGRTIEGVIQTSAAINPGNSGGPLLDSSARLIGVNTAIFSPSGTFAGIGFAIPVDEVQRVVPQLIASGKVTRPRLGVEIFNDRQAQRLGVEEGALLFRVFPDSPAARAGLRGTGYNEAREIVLGDVIVAIAGRSVKSGNDLFNALEKQQPGSSINVRILRNGQEMDVAVTLEPAD